MRVVIAFVLVAAVAAGCGDVNAALEQESRARNVSADLLVQFTKASDAADRAVMADTDELSVTFAKEAEQAKNAVQQDVDTLGPILAGLKFTDETRLLQDFVTRYADYTALDRKILDLAVENTNLKAQRLSFGPGQAAADEFRGAVNALASGGAEKDAWRIKALSAEAISAVREIQVLQAPHIADPDDSKMTEIESQMSAWQTVARNNLGTLAALTGAASRPRLTAATAALDKFMSVNAEIVALSRRNTNVRSLALSLDQKRTVTKPCEDSARALHDALAKRGYPKGR
jgi:hypothetical protein